MAGLIKREDIDEVRSRTRIDEVVGEHVTLKNGGVDSLKGLCPFHDERTPSFHVRPSVGLYHCFGCGESGDVFTFLQKIEGLTFTESVTRLADRAGIELRYEDGGGPDRQAAGTRQRLLDAHQVAGDFYRANLASPQAQPGRAYLTERGFDQQTCATYGIGFALQGWDNLSRHLRSRGFTTDELLAAGLVVQGRNGVYDRFRGRLIWPIRDVAGRTVGFGARRVFDDDQGPKYLNTPETVLYRKNQVLYGLDLAKRSIAKTRRVVIVEGYTDVMAAQLAGVDQAVATCGTAFGAEHVKIVRRLMGDDGARTGEVIFTFDGDEAGKAAALKAFNEDQKFVSQTFVAVTPGGMDPCELRQARGDGAVRDLVESRRPLVEFAITSTVDGYDLGTVEGRVSAIRAVAPMIAQIRDAALCPGYERFVAGHVGADVAEVSRAVAAARRRGSRGGDPGPSGAQGQREGYRQREPGTASPAGAPGPPQETEAGLDAAVEAYREGIGGNGQDATAFKVERGALQVALQRPEFVNARVFDSLTPQAFGNAGLRAVHGAMRDAGGVQAALSDPERWPEKVLQAAPDELRGLVGELAVSPLPASTPEEVERYSRGIVARLFDQDMVRIAGLLHSRLQRTDPADVETSSKLLQQLTVLERQRSRLRQQM